MPCPRVTTALALAPVLLLTSACESDRVAPRVLPGVTVTIVPAETVLAVGTRATLVAEVRNADGEVLTDRTITWSSGAPEIATVSGAGVVQALAPGRATISAFSEPGLGAALVAVQEDIRLPLAGGRRWLLLAETGTPAGVCEAGEGGLRHDGGRECSHAGVSRYSLDFAAVSEEEGTLASPDVLAAADGRVLDVCRLTQGSNCGPEGPFVLLEHRGGLRTVYGHLDAASISVRRKTVVAQGQRLGRTGSSTSEPGPWVHFELRFENRGAESASALEALLVDARKLRDYRVAPGEQRFYGSTNADPGEVPGN